MSSLRFWLSDRASSVMDFEELRLENEGWRTVRGRRRGNGRSFLTLWTVDRDTARGLLAEAQRRIEALRAPPRLVDPEVENDLRALRNLAHALGALLRAEQGP